MEVLPAAHFVEIGDRDTTGLLERPAPLAYAICDSERSSQLAAWGRGLLIILEADVVLGHLGLNVPDLDRAKEYYAEVMPMVGYETFLATEDEVAFMPAGGKRGAYIFLYPAVEAAEYSRHRPGLQHVAFMVPTRSDVSKLHNRVRDLGSEIIVAPQEFPQYPGPYFAMFWSDPFGFMLEAVCHHDCD